MILLVILFNWFIIFVMLSLFIPSAMEGLYGSLVGVVLLMGISHTPFMEKILRWTSGLRPALLEERLIVESFVNELSIKAHLKKAPDIYIADSSSLNAYAIGKHTVGITKGLLEKATREELFGVLAHEMGHLKHGDSMRFAIAKVFNAGGLLAAWVILHAARLRSFDILPEPSGIIDISFAVSTAVLYLLIGILGWYFGVGLRMVGPEEEYKADSFVVQAGGGSGFISFLYSTGSTEFSQRRSFWVKATVTHPPALLRIEQMKKRMEEITTH